MTGGGRVASLVLAALFVVAGALAQLLHAAPRLSGSNDVEPQQYVVTAPAAAGMCQHGETWFADTARLRMTIGTYGRRSGRLEVSVRDGARTVARGTLEPGWDEGVVDVAMTPALERPVAGATVCVEAAMPGRLAFGGEEAREQVGAVVDGEPRDGRVSLVSYAAGRASLLDLAGAIGKRYGHGSADWLGGWALLLAAALALAGFAAAVRALLVQRARWIVVTTLALGAAWALVTPTFMVPDEISHYGYVQAVVETGELPLDDAGPAFSERHNAVLAGTQFFDVIGPGTSRPPWTAAEEAALRAAERSGGSRVTRDASSASGNPPLYYLAVAPVYAATRAASPLTQLLPMRLASVLLAGLTVFLVFGFLRELLPGRPLLWTVGALAVALQPLFGFVSAGVNPDAALFAASAGTLWGIAVVLRRGATMRSVVWLGIAIAAGTLTKPLFLALVPAGLLALAFAALRADRDGLKLLGAGAAVALLPAIAYSLIGGAAFDHAYFAGGSPAVTGGVAAAAEGLRAELGYIWQLYLPRLPIMNDRFPGDLPLRAIWFDGFIGRFGWLDYGFPRWVTGAALWVAYAVLALAAAALVQARARLRERWRELACWALALVALLAAIGTQQYDAFSARAPEFTQARYLLPLLALYGALIAVAVSGARRWAQHVAVAVVALAALHSASALILTVARYYA